MPPPGRGYGGPARGPGIAYGPPPPRVNVGINIGGPPRPPPMGVGIGFGPPPLVIAPPPPPAVIIGAPPPPPVVMMPPPRPTVVVGGQAPVATVYSSNNSLQPSPGQVVSVVPKNDKHAILQSIASSYRRATDAANSNGSNPTAPQSPPAGGKLGGLAGAMGGATRRRSSAQRRRDCRVSHWSEWTACSKSCGIGEMHRYRKVIKHGKRGGRPCPALQQSKWCGTERNCHGSQTYFNWSDSDT
ncbi:hypothetical protein M5D96_008541 [Drosophila gunungcola]|uniref:Spondin-like TSP1 domain-containing protein n=1 Tax=Drosophila gunungcola TaxID=103775 RepID=A0A9P9YL71_9MUSC|nr:hypothetical protein M5D96_008541 [Drosophila gunungcola]